MSRHAPTSVPSVRWARRLSELLVVALCLWAALALLSFILTL